MMNGFGAMKKCQLSSNIFTLFEQNDIRILLKNSNKLDLIKSVLASIKLNIIRFYHLIFNYRRIMEDIESWLETD